MFATRLAVEYRMKFHKDVVIDLVCYRRLGHNEADEPAATQPVMYPAIRGKPTTRQLYADRLDREGVIAAGEADSDGRGVPQRPRRRDGKPQARNVLGMIGNVHTVDWSEVPRRGLDRAGAARASSCRRCRTLGARCTTYPEGFRAAPAGRAHRGRPARRWPPAS